MSSPNAPAVALQDVPELRRKTERISEALRQQLTAHLETLRPLFAPDRVFGKLAGGKTDVLMADKSVAELKEKYAPFSNKPYDLTGAFDTAWLPLVGSSLELYPWEYNHELSGKKIAMTSPVRWMLNYKSSYTLAKVRATLNGSEPNRPELVRQFVINTLVLQAVLKQNPGLAQLFGDLRYELKTETPAELKGLPVATITSVLTSFRPADDVISAATAFSGVPAFVELIDLEGVKTPRDVLRERLEQLLA